MDWKMYRDGDLAGELYGALLLLLPYEDGYRVEVSGRWRGLVERVPGGWRAVDGDGAVVSLETAVEAVYRADLDRIEAKHRRKG